MSYRLKRSRRTRFREALALPKANKEYDKRRTMKNKVNSNRNLDLLTEIIQQQDRSEGASKSKELLS